MTAPTRSMARMAHSPPSPPPSAASFPVRRSGMAGQEEALVHVRHAGGSGGAGKVLESPGRIQCSKTIKGCVFAAVIGGMGGGGGGGGGSRHVGKGEGAGATWEDSMQQDNQGLCACCCCCCIGGGGGGGGGAC